MDHDRLFKELLTNFMAEFIELFLPDLAGKIDDDIAFLAMDKEIFTDVTAGDKHEVDMLIKVKVRGIESFVLIHLEHQSRPQKDFAKRMFRYFARLEQKYDIPIYPVVIYSHDTPLQAEPDYYEMTILGRSVLRFQYRVIQLNALSWRTYVNSDNPLASALMAKMHMTDTERDEVKFECYQMLTRMKLDPARSQLIGGFVDSYLKLNAKEMKLYERRMEALPPKEKESTMALVSDWKQQGIDTGVAIGKEKLITRLIRHRFYPNAVPDTIVAALSGLSTDQLDDLGEALLDFAGVSDLKSSLDRH